MIGICGTAQPWGDHGGYHTSLTASRWTMPALSSSPVDPAIGNLADLAEDAREKPPPLLGVLVRVADSRCRPGCRQTLHRGQTAATTAPRCRRHLVPLGDSKGNLKRPAHAARHQTAAQRVSAVTPA